MRVLIFSEGEHELGGALKRLVERLHAQTRFECDHRTVRDPEFGAIHGKGPRLFKRAVRAMHIGLKHGYDAVVFVIDEDGDHERLRQLQDAQDHFNVTIARAFGVAIRTFDAWMLADEVALSTVLSVTVQRQPDPETIRGPKEVCFGLRDAHRFEGGMPRFYAALADHIDLATLESRCPRGFGVFAARVRNL